MPGEDPVKNLPYPKATSSEYLTLMMRNGLDAEDICLRHWEHDGTLSEIRARRLRVESCRRRASIRLGSKIRWLIRQIAEFIRAIIVELLARILISH
jgi:hypothetical protein